MPIHSLHIFDRRGKTLFSKRFIRDEKEPPKVLLPSSDDPVTSIENIEATKAAFDIRAEYEEHLEEQRKLIFGMLFSLREVSNSLSPTENNNVATADKGLHSVTTGTSTLFNYESNSGVRFAMYITHGSTPGAGASTNTINNSATIRSSLKFIADELWIQCVILSPLYTPTNPNVMDTNFETKLEAHLKAQPWYR
jgi:trafficking protein particle complex subunit 1